MKKLYLVIGCLFSMHLMTAQFSSLEYKSGVNLSNIKGKLAADSKVGMYAGLLANFELNDTFSLRPELLYSQEGASNAHIDYLRLPLMFKYSRNQEFNLLAGPNFGYMLNKSAQLDNVNAFDVGLSIGVLYRISQAFFVETRYYSGVVNIYRDGIVDSYNTHFSFGMGYRPK